MKGLADTIINHELARAIVVFVENLSPIEYKIIIVVSILALILIAYRWFGAGAVIAIVIILLVAYALYTANIKKVYEKQETDRNEHIKLIEEELKK